MLCPASSAHPSPFCPQSAAELLLVLSILPETWIQTFFWLWKEIFIWKMNMWGRHRSPQIHEVNFNGHGSPQGSYWKPIRMTAPNPQSFCISFISQAFLILIFFILKSYLNILRQYPILFSLYVHQWLCPC